MSEQVKEFVKAKYPNTNRKEWTEKDILKKILFEGRKMNDLLEKMITIFERNEKAVNEQLKGEGE